MEIMNVVRPASKVRRTKNAIIGPSASSPPSDAHDSMES